MGSSTSSLSSSNQELAKADSASSLACYQRSRQCQQSILQSLVELRALEFSYVRRLALHQSLQRDSSGEHARDVVLEAVVESPTLSAGDKERLCQCLVDDDQLLNVHSIFLRNLPAEFSGKVQVSIGNDFLDFRRMTLCIIRTSRKFSQALPVDSQQRVKAMILQTRTMDELSDLLKRMVGRTCSEDVQERIQNDVGSGRLYRLLLPDRLDCEESVQCPDDDKKMPAQSSGEVNAECPICINLIVDSPVRLECQHVFCRNCLKDWIQQHHPLNGKIAGSNGRAEGQQSWSCPVCRQTYYHSLGLPGNT